jgi:hypothetical protein
MQIKCSLRTEQQEADRLNVCLRTMVNWRNRRLIPVIRIGRMVRYDPADVDKALAKLTIKELV